LVSFRPTPAQALGHGALLGGAVGAAIGVLALLFVLADILAFRSGSPAWLNVTAPVLAGLAVGALTGLIFGRQEGADIDDVGIHLVPRIPDGFAAWQRIADVRTERRGGRTNVAVYLDTGRIMRLQAPYDGRWLAADREIERKLFMLRNLWETHRSFTLRPEHPTDAG
jgi:hypothetical protein